MIMNPIENVRCLYINAHWICNLDCNAQTKRKKHEKVINIIYL